MKNMPDAPRVEMVSINDIKPNPRAVRQHPKSQIRQLARSIEAFKFNVPLLVDRDNVLIAGHARIEAARLLGLDLVPVIRLEHLTPEQASAFSVAENRLGELGTWNERQLGEILLELSIADLDFALEATGFTMGEIDLRIEGLDRAADDDAADDLSAVPPGAPVSRPGDLWGLGPHTVLCGDALDEGPYEALMGADRAAMVFTDPPYNVRIDGNVSNLMGGKAARKHREFAAASGEMTEAQFVGFLTKACTLMAKASDDGALHYVCMDWRHLLELLIAGRSAFDSLLNICVWAKPNGGMGGLYRSAHELVVVFKHGRASHRNNVKLGKFGRDRTNVWSYPGSASLRHGEEADFTAQHPTPKPVRMIADAILDVTARADIVLDPFLGSGSTLIAADRVGRICRGIEVDPFYVDLTIRRWQMMTGETAVHAETGQTFEARSSEASDAA